MSKLTWTNLDYNKKQEIMVAAMNEFCNNSYEDASISNIVKQSNIAKGSFYQYFNDKKDLLFTICESLINNIDKPPSEEDIYDFAYKRFLSLLDLASNALTRDFLIKIFTCKREIIHEFMAKYSDHKQHLDYSHPNLIDKMLTHLTGEIIIGVGKQTLSVEDAKQLYNKYSLIIKKGDQYVTTQSN